MTSIFLIGIICMIIGIAVISCTFFIQKKEDEHRIPGYYMQGLVIANREYPRDNNIREVTFEFTKDFRILRCTNRYLREEALEMKIGRKYLIVYDEAINKIHCNPAKEYRKIQNITILVGGVILLIGINVSVLACGLIL